MTSKTKFPKNDHRLFNRHGEMFDVGETFAGVDFQTGLAAVEQLKELVPMGWILSQFALRWILMFDAVSVVIPGGKTPEQVKHNASASDMPPLSDETMEKTRRVYERLIQPLVGQRW